MLPVVSEPVVIGVVLVSFGGTFLPPLLYGEEVMIVPPVILVEVSLVPVIVVETSLVLPVLLLEVVLVPSVLLQGTFEDH